MDRKGYPQVGLYRDGKRTMSPVHKVVLEAFVGPRPDGMECRHLDGDRSNSCLVNLCWGTSSENKADMIKHGTSNQGERNGYAVLCAIDVWLIRHCKGIQQQLADFFGVSRVHVGNIRNRKKWKHLLLGDAL